MKNEEKCVFGIAEDKQTVIIGVSPGAWEYMKDGMTHTFDLNKLGVPVKLILFGGKDQASIKALLTKDDGLDLTGLDFGFGKEK